MKQKRNILKTINYLNAKTDIPRLKLFVDYVDSKIKYGINSIDYKILNIYNLKDNVKNNILTNRVNKQFIKIYNVSSKDSNISKSNIAFRKKFNKYLPYKWLELTGNNITEFYSLVENSQEIYARKDNKQNKEYKKEIVDLKNYTKTYNELVIKKYNVIESKIEELDEIKALNNKNLNIVRFIVVNKIIKYCYYLSRIDENKMDYIYAGINLDTGIIDYPAIDIYANKYDMHPNGEKNLYWYQMPKWPRTLRFIEKIALELDNQKYIQIDIIYTNDGPKLWDISLNPDHVILQLLYLQNEHIGIKEEIFKLLEEE